MLKRILVLGLCLALPAAAQTTHEGEPVYKPQVLTLANLPKTIGPAVSLFNGKDLNNWNAWLGYADPGQTYQDLAYQAKHDVPIGASGKGDAFSVVNVDGEPALYVKGQTWGSLVNKGDYANYHLHLEYRWSGQRYAPRLDQPENNGLLYHSHGAPGAVWGTWMRAVEFEIMTGSVGMVVPVGNDLHITSTIAYDPTLIDPKRRFMVGGLKAETVGNTADWNIENNRNADLAMGQWNTLDLYVVGNHAIHVVNGVPVMEVTDICDVAAAGAPCVPLTHGHIQLQSEGAGTFFRHITIEPIDHLPTIKVAE
jgi:hypothetical protein